MNKTQKRFKQKKQHNSNKNIKRQKKKHLSRRASGHVSRGLRSFVSLVPSLRSMCPHNLLCIRTRLSHVCVCIYIYISCMQELTRNGQSYIHACMNICTNTCLSACMHTYILHAHLPGCPLRCLDFTWNVLPGLQATDQTFISKAQLNWNRVLLPIITYKYNKEPPK